MLIETIAIAVLLSLIVLYVKPGTALAIVLASTLLWPEYLRIPMGPALMSVSRILALVLFTKFLLNGRFRGMRGNLADVLMLVYWVWLLAANIIENQSLDYLTRAIGELLDLILIYFVARLSLQREVDFKQLVVVLSVLAIYIGALAAYEAVTGSTFYKQFLQYRPWVTVFGEVEIEKRLGFYRATVSESIHIYFGITMSIIGGLLVTLHTMTRKKLLTLVGIAFAYLGVVSSFSTGPWIAALSFLLFRQMKNHTAKIKPLLLTGLALLSILHLISERGIHYVGSYLGLNSATAWYRGRLIDVAFSELGSYWLFGYGSNLPHYWGGMVDGRPIIDIVNHYILVAVYGGLMALVLFLSITWLAYRNIFKLKLHTLPKKERYVGFSLIAILFSLNVAMLSVSFYDTPNKYYFALLGIMISYPYMVKKEVKMKRIAYEFKEKHDD
ncbi:hypothetical protein GUA87_06035 [Sneathiella sp. P13V-1]|uniref:hypothetical protein n=1 Tax=Sneathiella sp. P13V-1 TaxID=2697366 RepID=UPI00187B6250|nr:hypothetical protein [Sneathiella sp. P13V-1]MBE7636397.1 hypothetical protein [Sneathiella sp. P13V-1]